MATKRKFNIKALLTAAARKIWRYYPLRREVFNKNLVQKRTNTKDNVYKCENCSFKGVSSEFDVDHTKPVVDPFEGFIGFSEEIGFSGWDNYYNRLFTTLDNLKLLCKPCHTNKTYDERQIRKIAKKSIDKLNIFSVSSDNTPKSNKGKGFRRKVSNKGKNGLKKRTSIKRSSNRKTKR